MWVISTSKNGFLGISERWFRYWSCFILTGVTALRLQHKTAPVVLLSSSQSGSLKWGWRGKEGKRAELWRQAISPSLPLQTFTQQGIQGPAHPASLQVPKAVKLWTKSHPSSSAVNGENERDAQKAWTIPQGLFQLGWTQALLSAVTEPETRHHLPLLTISFPCDKNFGLFLGSSILLCLAWGEKGKGSFLMGSWSKWIIARLFF